MKELRPFSLLSLILLLFLIFNLSFILLLFNRADGEIEEEQEDDIDDDFDKFFLLKKKKIFIINELKHSSCENSLRRLVQKREF